MTCDLEKVEKRGEKGRFRDWFVDASRDMESVDSTRGELGAWSTMKAV